MLDDNDGDDEDADGVGVGDEIVIWGRHCYSPREANYRSRTVAVGTAGRGAVPYSFPVAVVIAVVVAFLSRCLRRLFRVAAVLWAAAVNDERHRI